MNVIPTNITVMRMLTVSMEWGLLSVGVGSHTLEMELIAYVRHLK